MNQPWATIVARYEQHAGENAAVESLLRLSREIANGPLASGLHGWTSMLDLCITQTEVVHPYEGPYLRISPLADGQVEFRYFDTRDFKKQWHRTVDAADTMGRLLSFLRQLKWFSGDVLPQ